MTRLLANPVRVRPAPPLEPPFDDERPTARSQACAVPMLPIDWSAKRSGPTRPPDRRPPGGPALATACGPDGPARPPGDRHPSAAWVAAQRFVGVCVEVLSGHRPVHHLRAITAPGQLTDIADRLIRRTTRIYLAPPGTVDRAPAGPSAGVAQRSPRSSGTASQPAPPRVRIVRVHVSEPRDGVAEVVAVLSFGPRVWALAARLERRDETWLCTVAEVP